MVGFDKSLVWEWKHVPTAFNCSESLYNPVISDHSGSHLIQFGAKDVAPGYADRIVVFDIAKRRVVFSRIRLPVVHKLYGQLFRVVRTSNKHDDRMVVCNFLKMW